MDEGFHEGIRYEYPLTPESVVLDCGGYEGQFAAVIAQRYDCTVHVLEPVLFHWGKCINTLRDFPKAHIYNFGIGVGVTPHGARFKIKGSMTGLYADGEQGEEDVMLLGGSSILRLIGTCDLMKLNIEGGEFGVLAALIDTGDIRRCGNIQVQWHPVVPECERWRESIMEKLSATHELTWDFGWVWQNWRLKA